MAITVGGRVYRTLSDDLYVNGSKVYEVTVNGEKVYPEGKEGVLFFIDTSGSMSAKLAISAIGPVDGADQYYAAMAYGGHSDMICDWTRNVDEVIAAVNNTSFSGSGDDEYPLQAMLSLANNPWVGDSKQIVVIGDYEFTFNASDSALVSAVYAEADLTWRFVRVG
jgi:hypothetical protein